MEKTEKFISKNLLNLRTKINKELSDLVKEYDILLADIISKKELDTEKICMKKIYLLNKKYCKTNKIINKRKKIIDAKIKRKKEIKNLKDKRKKGRETREEKKLLMQNYKKEIILNYKKEYVYKNLNFSITNRFISIVYSNYLKFYREDKIIEKKKNKTNPTRKKICKSNIEDLCYLVFCYFIKKIIELPEKTEIKFFNMFKFIYSETERYFEEPINHFKIFGKLKYLKTKLLKEFHKKTMEQLNCDNPEYLKYLEHKFRVYTKKQDEDKTIEW